MKKKKTHRIRVFRVLIALFLTVFLLAIGIFLLISRLGSDEPREVSIGSTQTETISKINENKSTKSVKIGFRFSFEDIDVTDQMLGTVISLIDKADSTQTLELKENYEVSLPEGHEFYAVITEFSNPYYILENRIITVSADSSKIYNIQLSLNENISSYSFVGNQIMVSSAFLNVPVVLQNPELPNGCEITAMTSILNYYGEMVGKTDLSDKHLEKVAFTIMEGRLMGANPEKAFAGNPRNHYDFYVFEDPVLGAAQSYLNTVKNVVLSPLKLSGREIKDIKEDLLRYGPIAMWVTLDMGKPIIEHSWYIKDSGELYLAYTNLHCMVLMGFTENTLIFMNPEIGVVEYDKSAVEMVYNEMGKRAITIVKKSN